MFNFINLFAVQRKKFNFDLTGVLSTITWYYIYYMYSLFVYIYTSKMQDNNIKKDAKI